MSESPHGPDLLGFRSCVLRIFIYLTTFFVAAPLNLCSGQFFTVNSGILHLFAHFHCKLIRALPYILWAIFLQASVDLCGAYFWARAVLTQIPWLIDPNDIQSLLWMGLLTGRLEHLPHNEIQSRVFALSQLFCPLVSQRPKRRRLIKTLKNRSIEIWFDLILTTPSSFTFNQALWLRFDYSAKGSCRGLPGIEHPTCCIRNGNMNSLPAMLEHR